MPETLRALREVLPESLRQEKDFFAETQDIEHALAPIFIYDAESHAMLAVNTAAQRLYGYGEAEFLRPCLLDVLLPEEMDRVSSFLSEGWLPRLRRGGVWRHKARDGRVFSVSMIGLGIEFKGRPAILAIVTDLTQTLHASSSPDATGPALFPFAEQMKEVVCCVRSLKDHRLVYVNPAIERVFGLTREAAYADPAAVQHLVLDEDVGDFLRYREICERGAAQAECRIRRPDGEMRWITLHSFILADAAGERMVADFSEDITARKEAEQRRLALLEDQRDALVREVSHRIKNSLQGVTGLLRRAATAQPQLASTLAEVAAQLQGLATVHGLQARTVSGRVELCALLRGIAAAAESLGLVRIEVVIPPHCDPCLVVAEKDAVPLALALNELVINAVKHAKPGGKTRIAAEADLAAGAAEIRIVNAGRLSQGIGRAGGGSGLELVRMLLPPKGACFELTEAAGKVTATLRLKAPVVQPHG